MSFYGHRTNRYVSERLNFLILLENEIFLNSVDKIVFLLARKIHNFIIEMNYNH
jgi:hypothetical protein